MTAPSPDFNVLIVGAGISGIGVAAHLADELPGKRFAVLEARAALGGTWDLFRYPGVRSDSDMHTLGYAFEPWAEDESIAGGAAILAYLQRIVDERDLRRRIRFGCKVLAAAWDGAEARWTLAVETAAGREELRCRFLILGSGYYDYDTPHDPQLPGLAAFTGTVVHPQFWPAGLDVTGKRVVVIGSGATAATLIPALAATAEHVTMLQRTPTWYAARPSRDAIANGLRKLLPRRWAYAVTRFKNVRFQDYIFRRARREPAKVAAFLTRRARQMLGDTYDAASFTPPYGPWQQRLCLIPDGDLYAAIRSGRAGVVTDRIEGFDADGVRLASGERLAADVIVTATGLKLAVAGKIALSIDGAPVNWPERYYYRNCMFSGVPNFAAVFGYLNAAWTLRVDLVAAWLCRVLHHMDASGADVAVPVLPEGEPLVDDPVFEMFSSGYLQRALADLPRSATAPAWRLNQDYLADRRIMRDAPLDDGLLRFAKAGAAAELVERQAHGLTEG